MPASADIQQQFQHDKEVRRDHHHPQVNEQSPGSLLESNSFQNLVSWLIQNRQRLRLLLLLPSPQLPASRVDIPPPALSHMSIDAAFPQYFLKFQHVIRFRPAIRKRLHFVVSNE